MATELLTNKVTIPRAGLDSFTLELPFVFSRDYMLIVGTTRYDSIKPERHRGYSASDRFRRILFEFQRGFCALCWQPLVWEKVYRRSELPWEHFDSVVDHSHQTGYVRGLIHSECNQVLSFVERGWENVGRHATLRCWSYIQRAHKARALSKDWRVGL